MSEPTTAEDLFDSRRLRDVLGQYPTGVALVTGVAADGDLLAMVVGTFSSVSLEPPLVSFMPMRTSRTWRRLRECSSLCISVLGAGQEEAVRTLGAQWQDRFAGLAWSPSPSGDPVLTGSLAWLDVRVEQVVEAGDHQIVLCRVLEMDSPTSDDPLIFFRGGYGTFTVPSLVTGMERDIAPAVHHAESARPVLESLAADLDCEAAMMHRSGEELVAVASAVGRDKRVTCALGLRVPAVPPVADIFVAFDGPEAQQEWLARVGPDEQAALDVYRERLVFAREHGFLMSFHPPGGDEDWAGLTPSLGHRGQRGVTQEQEGDLHDARRWTPAIYRPRVLADDEAYDLGSLVVPVRSRDGRTVHSLRLSQLRHGVDGAEVSRWVQRLRLAAARVETLLG